VQEKDGPIMSEIKKYHKESRRRRIFYKQQKEERLIGLVTFCVLTAFCNALMKGR